MLLMIGKKKTVAMLQALLHQGIDAIAMTRRVAIVTGASSSLGRCISKHLGDRGYTAIDFSRSSREYPCDIRLSDACDAQIRNVVTAIGPVEVLVNCVGVNADRLLIRSSPSDFTSIYETNVVGAMNISRSCIKHGGMLKGRQGSIVNIGSSVGVYGNSGQVAYAASKAALIGATKSIAKEYADYNIRCNILCPGLISGTRMWEALSPNQREHLQAQSLLKRCATVDEVADAAVFLATNTFVNGHALILDGGS